MLAEESGCATVDQRWETLSVETDGTSHVSELWPGSYAPLHAETILVVKLGMMDWVESSSSWTMSVLVGAGMSEVVGQFDVSGDDRCRNRFVNETVEELPCDENLVNYDRKMAGYSFREERRDDVLFFTNETVDFGEQIL